jgi:putative SOS response-associated peptidase YedK
LCYGFAQKVEAATLMRELLSRKRKAVNTLDDKKQKKENVSPTDFILTIHKQEEKYLIDSLYWGIKFSDELPLIANSRIETVKEKLYWRGLLDKSRYIIPMTGFYEWKKEGNKKVRYKIFLPDEDFFFTAAIGTIDKDKRKAVSLITTTPNKFMKPVHNRMPVLLRMQEGIDYLTDSIEVNLKRCKPLDDDIKMEMILDDKRIEDTE